MKQFGTDGLRGEYGKVVTEDDAFLLGIYLGSKNYMTVIARDPRESGKTLLAALAAGIREAEGRYLSLGVAGTPEVCFAVTWGKFDGGVVVTASHNTSKDNGLKVIGRGGKELTETECRRIERYLDKPYPKIPYPPIPSGLDQRTGEALRIHKAYLHYLRSFCGWDDRAEGSLPPLSGLRLGLDCANGAAALTAPALFESLGAQVYLVGASPDGWNINEGCGSTHPEALQKLVAEKELDAGFAYDGDADRCIMAGPGGKRIDGDGILYLCAGTGTRNRGEDADARNKPLVVGTVMSNLGLEQALAERGIRLLRADVGIHAVARKMEETGASLGGEPSGHILFAGAKTGGDGILTSLICASLLRKGGSSRLLDGFFSYPQTLCNVKVRDKRQVLSNPEVSAAFMQLSEEYKGRGRLLLRPSGTEEVFRVMAEAESESLSRKLAEEMAEICRRACGAEEERT